MSNRNIGTLFVHVLASSCLAAVFGYLVYAYEATDGYSLLILMLYGFAVHIIQSIHRTEDRARYHEFLMGGDKLRSGRPWGTFVFSFAAGVLGLGGGLALHSMGFDVVRDMRYVIIGLLVFVWVADLSAIIRTYRYHSS